MSKALSYQACANKKEPLAWQDFCRCGKIKTKEARKCRTCYKKNHKKRLFWVVSKEASKEINDLIEKLKLGEDYPRTKEGQTVEVLYG